MKLKPVYLEWLDACSNTNGWMTLSEAKRWCEENKWYVQQLGFIIYENKKEIAIVGEAEPGDRKHLMTVGLIQKIPKTWIRKRIDLSKYIK